ncbi:MAG: hypothetical protein N2512_06780 [Armatimonadetes bacterium]|nr:hypothetical protein [Armatimonadota bacterium]
MCDQGKIEACATTAGRRDLRASSWLLAALVIVATAYHWHPGGGWNVMTRLALIRAIVHDRTLSINRGHRMTGDKAEYPPGSGIYYCDKPVGAQVLGLAGYVIGLHAANRPGLARRTVLTAAAATATWFASGLPTVALALVMLQLLVSMGHTLRRAVFIVLATIFGTLLWPYATLFYGHQASACFAFTGFAFAFWAAHGRLGVWAALLAGFFCAWAAVSELPAAFTLVAVAGYLFFSRPRMAAFFILGTLPPVALQLAYNYACFDSPLRFGYMFEANPEFRNPAGWVSYPRPGVLLSLLFSSDKGLLFLSPHLAFAAWGLYRGIRRHQWRREAAVCMAVAAGFLLYNAGHYLWWGGTCFGPRHLVSMLPFLGLGLAWAWPEMGSAARHICLVLLSWAALVSFAAVSTSPDASPFPLTRSCGPAEVLLRLWVGRLEWPNLGLWLGFSAHGSILFHAVLLAALLTALAVVLHRSSRGLVPQVSVRGAAAEGPGP